MDELIKADLYRYAGRTDFRSFLRSLRIPGFRYTYFMRKSAKHGKYSLAGIFYRIFYHHYTYKYGFQIAHHTKIGKGFQISHFGCVVINSKAIIGDNCYVSHNVTIGQTNRGRTKGYPTIGNKVWIGAGAVIVGNVTIGDNVLIAPNAYVPFDVPANSVVIGNPAKIIANELATADYIVNTVH
ncbi:serine O-acetyltransferase [Spirosoma endbachense]|uniref:Serine acetyltransferase n=1 Tax=Spirosoma endbachense TaxID=2666025 RepID=A0A6P1VNR9_9BACT|nr:serine acetyltransferase [Spirosoma endbachense]QHV94068.1 serine acetyltransferase [Spirosoma endbachense]